MILLSFVACWYPFDEYWSDESQFPVIDSVEPSSLASFAGGEEVVLTGRNLASVQTAVVGTRNAEILEATDTSVRIQVPNLPGGDRSVDVAVVSLDGWARAENALTYTSTGTDWWDKEIGSFSVLTLDCPLEAYGSYDEEYYPLFWCGLEMGYSEAIGSIGSERQSGFAADGSILTGLSALPPAGQARYWATPPVSLPSRYGASRPGDWVKIETDRDLARDLAYIDERIELFQSNYYWTDYITAVDRSVAFADEQYCYLFETTEVDFLEDTLSLSEDAGTISAVWMGYSAVEEYEEESWFYEGYTSTGTAQADGTQVTLGNAGGTLEYSDYSGFFIDTGVGTAPGPRNFPFGVSYRISIQEKDQRRELGNVEGGGELVLTWPDLLAGQEQISKTDGVLFEWEPLPQSNDPVLVVAEFRVYDMDVDDPNGWYEVARIVKSAADADGYLEITPEEISPMPLAPNAIDEEDDFVGLWGELTIARHEFRKVAHGENDIVIDFVHSIQSPVDLID
ncbi:MAG: IPT/TIG domain-containing protein [Myxococcota bacterium]|nr:IPT/TIG domain-containing protein [Myxococcota bacterium]